MNVWIVMKKFNEEQYLKNYPDVAAAVERGQFKND